jgi:hypothetical protein
MREFILPEEYELRLQHTQSFASSCAAAFADLQQPFTVHTENKVFF